MRRQKLPVGNQVGYIEHFLWNCSDGTFIILAPVSASDLLHVQLIHIR